MWDAFKKVWEKSNDNQRIMICVSICLAALIALLLLFRTCLAAPKTAMESIEGAYAEQEGLSVSLRDRLIDFYTNEIKMKKSKIKYTTNEISKMQTKLEAL